MINIITIIVLLSGVIVILFLVFAVRIGKYQRQKLINNLSSSLMYKTKDLKSIIDNNITALAKIQKIKKELFYSCVIVTVAILSLWLLSDGLIRNFPKSILPLAVIEVWLILAVLLIIEYLLKTINDRLQNGGQ